MRLAAVSQRRVREREDRDSLDRAWADFLAACGLLCAPVPNAPDRLDAWLERIRPEAVLLTGGNAAPGTGQEDASPERDAVERALIAWAGHNRLPLLGVCRGAQMLNHFHGGALRRLSAHVATRHGLTGGASAMPLPADANSYHDFGLLPGDLGSGLRALAHAPDGSVELFVHASLPQAGMLWHPERQTPFRPEDIALVRAFLEVTP